MFRSLTDNPDPVCVLLTDGKYGSAFFEHRYLSDLLGIPMVEGPDLYVGPDGKVYVRTLDQDVQVDVIYRRVEDLDLFVPGLREAYLDGKVALVNGIGTGAADDKLVFLWVPQMIEQLSWRDAGRWSRPAATTSPTWTADASRWRTSIASSSRPGKGTAGLACSSCRTWARGTKPEWPTTSCKILSCLLLRRHWIFPSTWFLMNAPAASNRIT